MGAVGLQTYIWNNNLRSALLLVLFPVLLLAMVFALTLGLIGAGWLPYDQDVGPVGEATHLMLAAAPVALLVAGLWFAIAYLFNQSIIDFATGSMPVERAEEPQFYNLLENLAISRGMKTPAARVIETDALNAFASGLHEGRFSVTVTRGLLQSLNKDELEAVLAHELTHVINRDVRTMVIASIFAGIITLLCQILSRALYFSPRGRDRGGLGVFWIVAMITAAVGYVLAILIRMTISRQREYVADAGSVELTKNPDAMISALQKVAGHTHLDAPQSMRAMFLEEDNDGVFGLFASHPPVAKRVAALQRYAGGRVVERPGATALPAQVDSSAGDAAGPWGPSAAPDIQHAQSEATGARTTASAALVPSLQTTNEGASSWDIEERAQPQLGPEAKGGNGLVLLIAVILFGAVVVAGVLLGGRLP